MGDDEITYYNWNDVFAEIGYAHDSQYKPRYWKEGSIEYINFHKLTLTSEGEMEYKGNVTRFDPKLWPRVKLVYSTFEEGGVVDILYGNQKP
jgi:hypothetical protein